MAVSAFQLHDTNRNGIPSDVKCKLPVHEPTQGRTPLSARVTGAGIRFFVPGRADCRVASRREASALGVLLAMTQCVGDGVLDFPFPVIPSQCAPRSKCPWGTDWRGNPFLCRGGRLCPPCMANAATGKRIATPVTRSLVRNDSASRCRGRRPRRPASQGRTTLSALPCQRVKRPPPAVFFAYL